MDFFLGDPFTVDEVKELVDRYDRGEGGPPPGWAGFTDLDEMDYSEMEPELLALNDRAKVDYMRSMLSPENFNRWFELIEPGMNERLRRAESWQGPRQSLNEMERWLKRLRDRAELCNEF